jgi:hypothetical protein
MVQRFENGYMVGHRLDSPLAVKAPIYLSNRAPALIVLCAARLALILARALFLSIGRGFSQYCGNICLFSSGD